MSVTISGSGQIIKQVVQVQKTAALSMSLASTWGDVSGWSATITPTSASNKILVVANIGMMNANNNAAIRFTRNGTAFGVGDAAGSRTQVSFADAYTTRNQGYPASWSWLDSPATTSPVTYQMQAWIWASYGLYLNMMVTDSDISYSFRGASTITLYEVAYA